MPANIDDLLRAADKGERIGTTQRYFKPGVTATPAAPPASAPTPAPQPAAPAESEKDLIDRVLGRKKQSMSDVDEPPVAGQQFAMAETGAAPEKVAAKDQPDRAETLANVRRMYPAYKDVDDVTLGNGLAAKYPQYAFLKTEVPRGEGPPDSFDTRTPEQRMVGGVLNPGQPKELNFAQKVGNAVLPPLVAAPAIGAAGELVPAAPAVGRALASGLFGGAKAASSGKGAGGIAWDAVVDTLLGGVSEGAAGLATRLKIPFTGLPSLKEAGEKVPGAKAGFERGTKSLDTALDAIRDRLPKGKWVNAPSLGDKKMTVEEAVAKLRALTGDDFKQGRGELVSELTRLDMQRGVRGARGPTPYAGQAFNLRATPERFVYKGTPGERASTRILDFARNPSTRAAIDAEAEADAVVKGIPNALLPLLGATEGTTLGDLARHVRPRP